VSPDDYLPFVETHLVPSHYVSQTFRIEVMQPLRKQGETTRFPVIYATDGNLAFDALKGISYSLQKTGRDAPRFILVGIGYPGDSPDAGAVLRARDFTFAGYPEVTSVQGGAPQFQQFLQSELIRLIDERYPTIPGERSYFGHSGGGGFGLFTLFNQPELFRNYIVSSPGLIYHGTSPVGVQYDHDDFMLRDARRFIASGKPLEGVQLYMSVGAQEEFEPGLEQWQLTSSFHRMAALLEAARIPGLTLTTEVFPAETHMTVWPMAFIHGVRAVLGKRGRGVK